SRRHRLIGRLRDVVCNKLDMTIAVREMSAARMLAASGLLKWAAGPAMGHSAWRDLVRNRGRTPFAAVVRKNVYPHSSRGPSSWHATTNVYWQIVRIETSAA